MSFSLEYFKSRKSYLIEQLNMLHFVLQEMGNEADLKKLREAKNQVLEDQFQVVVVGEFSRGKSTFINGLLGTKILPSSPRPTTTLLNVISYSKEPFIKLHFNDQKGVKNITEENFKKLVAPKEPLPGDLESEKAYESQVELFKTIKFAEIGHPLSFCEGGVQIIDTPGTNDLDPAREQLTNNIIPKSDAAILILSAIKILSESEISFLRDRILMNDIQKIFIVINFKDLLENPEDINKVYDFAYENLKDILHEPKIFMVAAKEALNAKRKENGEEMITKRGRPIPVWDLDDTGFPDLESALANFLQYERGAVKLQKPIQKMIKLTNDILEKQVAFEQRSLNQEIEGLQEKVATFRPQLDKVRQAGKESLKKIIMDLKEEEGNFERWYEQELQKISDKGIQTFESNRHLGINEISSKVEKAIAPMERTIHEKKKIRMTEKAKSIIEDRSNDLNKKWFKLEGEMQMLSFGAEMKEFQSLELSFEQQSSPSIFDEIFEELDTAWENSTSFIGKVALGAGYIVAAVAGVASFLFKAGLAWLTGEDEKTKFRRKLINQFDMSKRQRQLSLKNEWEGMVNAVYKQYEDVVHKNVRQMENQLNQLLNNTQLEEKEIEEKLAMLGKRAQTLKKIKTDLDLLYGDLEKSTIERAGIK